MSRILADKVTNYNNDGPFEAEKGINIPLARPLQISGNAGVSGQYLVSTGVGLTWETFPDLFSGNYNDLTNKPSLFSGSYNDLTNKPAILNINLGVPANNQYLKFNGSQWINSDLPTIYQYSLSTSFNEITDIVSIQLVDQFFETVNAITLQGSNGIVVSDDNGNITITSPTVSEYDVDTAKDDISDMFLNGTNTGITYTYNPITKTINSSVSLAEQLVYTLYGFSDTPNEAKIYLDNGTIESGSVTLIGTNGIEIAWNIGESTITFSKDDPDPYVLPPASTTTLGGVIPDASDFNIDGLGNLTVNFPSGITLSDLSVGTEGNPSGNGDLSYNNTTGQFTYTPPSFSLDNLNDVSIFDSIEDQVLTFNGSFWQNTFLNIPSNLDDLSDVNIGTPLSGDIIQYDGSSWSGGSLNISGSPIEELSNVGIRNNNDAGQILIWGGTSWDPKKAKLQEFDISQLPTNGQTLVWNGTTSLWDPTTLSGGGGATTLDSLTDVSVTGAASGDYLYYNGSSWVNTTIPVIPEYLSDLLDVSDAAASNGYVLTWNSTASEWQPAVSGASPGAGLTSRTTASGTTASILNEDYDTININGYKSYSLMKIQTSAAAWVTLYCDDASRTADLLRSETTDPIPGSGVIAEVITTGAETILMTPTVMGFNNDATPGATIYAKVVNKSGSTQTITVTLTLLQLEA